MKTFGKLLAILAIFLILSSLVAVWVYPLMQPAICEYFTGETIEDFDLQLLPFSETLTCLTLLVCGILLLCLVGRRRGGAAIEIILLAFMFLCLPVINFVNDYLCFYIKEGIHLYFYSGWELEKILLSGLETIFSLNGLWWYFRNGSYSYYYYERFFEFLIMAGANLAQLLLYVICGISAGLTVKNRKEKIAE